VSPLHATSNNRGSRAHHAPDLALLAEGGLALGEDIALVDACSPPNRTADGAVFTLALTARCQFATLVF